MDSYHLIASIVAGVFWGSWVFILNKSGLPPYIAPGVFGLASFVTTMMLTGQHYSWPQITSSHLHFAIIAGAVGATGTVVFVVNMPSAVSDITKYYLLNLVVQISVPALYDMYISGVTTGKVLRFLLVIATAVALKI